MRVPRKPPKFKTRSNYKARLNSAHPRSPYEYSIYQLRILLPNRKHCCKELIPLQRTLILLFNKGRITYHGPDCYISTNRQFLIDFFKKHTERLRPISHPDFNRLSKIYYSIKILVA